MLLRRLTTLTVWALVGWTAMALLLRLLATPLAAPPGTQALAPEVPAAADLTPLFGAVEVTPVEAAAPAAPELSSRLQLLGVVAPREPGLQTQQGLALISVDGTPARAFRVGQPVLEGLRLLSVGARSAGLGQGQAVQVQLQVPELAPASTGVLPAVALSAAPAPPPVMPQAPQQQAVPAGLSQPGAHSQPTISQTSPQMPAYNANQVPERDDDGGPRRPPPTSPHHMSR